MRSLPILSLVVLAACAGAPDDAAYPAAHAVVDKVAGEHSDVVRLTLHAVPQGQSESRVIASTAPEKRGQPSDPEDLVALDTGEVQVLEEAGALDVTVPILVRGGKATAVAGVTLTAAQGADRSELITRARVIAEQIAAGVRAAEKPLW